MKNLQSSSCLCLYACKSGFIDRISRYQTSLIGSKAPVNRLKVAPMREVNFLSFFSLAYFEKLEEEDYFACSTVLFNPKDFKTN